MTSPGEIPQSTALAEAKVDSLTDLLSRDPMSYQAQDRKVIVERLRAMREKWEATDGKPKAAKGVKSAASPLSAEDLGL